MAHATRFHRRRMFRPVPSRRAWLRIRRDQVRRGLRALEALAGR